MTKLKHLVATVAALAVATLVTAVDAQPAKKKTDAAKRSSVTSGAADGSLEESPNPFTGLRYSNEDYEQMKFRSRIQAEIAGQNAQYEQSMLQVEENRKRREQLKRYGLAAPAHLAASKPLANDLIGSAAGNAAPSKAAAQRPAAPTAPPPVISSATPTPPRPAFVVGVMAGANESIVIREGAQPVTADQTQVDRALRQLRPASTVGRVQVDNRDPVLVPSSGATAPTAKPASGETPAKADPAPTSPGALSSAPSPAPQ